MAVVSVTNVVVMNNPTGFNQPLQFRITFQSARDLEEDLEWKLVYVGSAEDTRYDQVLEEVMVGPVHVGVNEFVLHAEAPDPTNIPECDLVGVTVVFITSSYRDKEFLRVGYYINNEHSDPAVNEAIAEGQPMTTPILVNDVTRNILSDRPRVTRFPIDWGAGDPTVPPPTGGGGGGDAAVGGSAGDADDDALLLEDGDDAMEVEGGGGEEEAEDDDGLSEDQDLGDEDSGNEDDAAAGGVNDDGAAVDPPGCVGDAGSAGASDSGDDRAMDESCERRSVPCN